MHSQIVCVRQVGEFAHRSHRLLKSWSTHVVVWTPVFALAGYRSLAHRYKQVVMLPVAGGADFKT